MIRAAVLLIVLAELLCAGCGQEEPKGPTYAEAVQLYTVEMQELQRLQAERARIEQSSQVNQVLTDLKGGLLGVDVNVSKQDLDALASGAGKKMDKVLDRMADETKYNQWYAERTKRGEQLKDPAAETEAIKEDASS